jgi:hypothetical protein
MGNERLGSRAGRRQQFDVVLVHYCRPVGVWAELFLDGEDILPDCVSGYSGIWSSICKHGFETYLRIDANVCFDAGFSV